jgi:hypothetical protein
MFPTADRVAPPAPPTATCEVGARVSTIACCTVPGFEHCVLAGGDGHLKLLGVQQAVAHADGVAFRPLPEISLAHESGLDAVAWGPEVVNGEMRLAAVGGGQLSIHRLAASGGEPINIRRAMPADAGRARSCCYLQQRQAEQLAVTGDGCQLHILNLAASEPVLRRQTLSSPGVAVRSHPREPEQLMVAQDDGNVHFIDLRVPNDRPSLSLPNERPSLSRYIPAADTDPAGCCDADWSLDDPYLVGGVVGSRWVAWDLRQPGRCPPPQSVRRAPPRG